MHTSKHAVFALVRIVTEGQQGDVEEDLELFVAVQRWKPTPSAWAGLYTDANRLFPSSPTGRAEDGDEQRRRRPGLAVLCDEFPELVSGYPGGLMLRHLPVQHIARLSMTAKSWRHLIQDPNVWKLLCALAWPGCKRSQVSEYGGSWRSMYMHRPRPRMDGFYCFKWSTARHGHDEGRGMKEAGKDFYKPVIITLMYKVILFQPGGKVTCMTTNSEAVPPEKLLRYVRRAQLRMSSKKIQGKLIKWKDCVVSVGGVVTGRYILQGHEVTLTFSHVPEDNPNMYPIRANYHMLLESTSTARNDVLTQVLHTIGRCDC